MSKIGMKAIIVDKANIQVNDNVINASFSGRNFVYKLTEGFVATFDDKKLKIALDVPELKEGAEGLKGSKLKKYRTDWGLHRALVCNGIKGVEEGFVSTVKIVGLGYKALMQGQHVVMSLGYSHKIEFDLDPLVTMETDKSGQLLTLKSFDKFKLGEACAHIRSLRPPEPYKGTGIYVNNEKINRKAGKSSKK